eukprot:TRINITY_DN29620_c0_g2_i1.p1 TRINITY_DN29620_c0_g2~~TRINITY_DN29620_c0_g2_i1.p1  ORF type:complete len:482 (-),score=0.43 TRINITY_DN29620_c0_g2_i1:270-1715(-)
MSSFIQRTRRYLSVITLEPALILLTFSWGLSSVIGQNLIILKSCRDLGYSDSICSDINHHKHENIQVEKRAAVVQMYTSILAAIPSIVIALFVGPWSDTNGRKPIMIFSILGTFLAELVWLLNVYYMDSSAWFLLFTSITGWFGGFTVLLIGVYSYLADISTIRSRTSRLALLDFCFFGGVPIGMFVSPYVFHSFGFYGIFGAVAGCQALSGVYISLYIDETVLPHDNSLTVSSQRRFEKYLNIINIDHMKQVFQATFRKRQHKLRRVILLLIFSMLLNVTVFNDGNIMYLYTRKQFLWTEVEYTRYLTLSICISAAATCVIMPLLSYILKVDDSMIGILSTMSKASSFVVIGLAANGTTLIFGSCIGCIGGLASIIIRSMLSKCVQPTELGKIYSLLASLEAAVPLFAAPMFTSIYNSTLETSPNAVFFVLASIFSVVLVNFVYIFFVLSRSGQDFSVLIHEEEVEDNDVYPNIDNTISS